MVFGLRPIIDEDIVLLCLHTTDLGTNKEVFIKRAVSDTDIELEPLDVYMSSIGPRQVVSFSLGRNVVGEELSTVISNVERMGYFTKVVVGDPERELSNIIDETGSR